MVFFFLNCSLHCVIGAVVGFPLSLRQQEDNSSENRGEVVSRKCPQKSVESPVHQQDKYAGAGSCEGGVKGLGDLYGKTWDCKLSKKFLYEGVVSKEDDGLLKGGVIAIAGGGDDELVEDRIGQDVDQEYLSLGDRETEEVDGDFIGEGV